MSCLKKYFWQLGSSLLDCNSKFAIPRCSDCHPPQLVPPGQKTSLPGCWEIEEYQHKTKKVFILFLLVVLELVGLMPHVPDGVVVRLDHSQACQTWYSRTTTWQRKWDWWRSKFVLTVCSAGSQPQRCQDDEDGGGEGEQVGGGLEGEYWSGKKKISEIVCLSEI